MVCKLCGFVELGIAMNIRDMTDEEIRRIDILEEIDRRVKNVYVMTDDYCIELIAEDLRRLVGILRDINKDCVDKF